MKLLLTLACVMALASTTVAIPSLVWVQDMTHVDAYHMTGLGYDLYGEWEGSSFLVADSDLIRELEANLQVLHKPNLSFKVVGPVDVSRRLVILEKLPETEWKSELFVSMSKEGEFLKVTDDLLILSLPGSTPLSHAVIDMELLPEGSSATPLAPHPVTPVPFSAQYRIQRHHAKLIKRRSIEDLLEQVSEDRLKEYAEILTGEAASSNFHTRHSQSQDAIRSGEYVGAELAKDGFNVTYEPFRDGYCPNVIGDIPGTLYPDEYVIIGAHLDCRSENINDPTARAPGANDDGSGSAMLLEVSRILYDAGVSFERTVRIGFWCGEEQGLYGSSFHAAESKAQNLDIVGMLQGDMIAYSRDATPELAFVTRFTDPTFTSYLTDVAKMYVPDLRLTTSTACCSDHQPFYTEGYPSAGYVESGGYSIDPQYHRTGDIVNREGYLMPQLAQITRAMLAGLADLAVVVEAQ